MAWNTATDRIMVYNLTMLGPYDAEIQRCMVTDHEFYVVAKISALSLTGASAVMDLSSATSAKLILVQPNGIEAIKTMSNRTDGTDGYVQYLIDVDDIGELFGRWRVRVEVAWGTAITSTNHGVLDVLEHGSKGGRSGVPTTTDPAYLPSMRPTNKVGSAGGGLVGKISLVDGIQQPQAVAGEVQIFCDIADGRIKALYGDSHLEVVAEDS